MPLANVDVRIEYTQGLQSSADSGIWITPDAWDSVGWEESTDPTQDTLSFKCLLASGREDDFEGIVSVRLTITQDTQIVQRYFQAKSVDLTYMEVDGAERVEASVKCATFVNGDDALEFLRKTFPAQVWDVAKSLGRELRPQLGALLDTDFTIGNIARPNNRTENHEQAIAFILARAIPRLIQYDEKEKSEEDGGGLEMNSSGIRLNPSTNIGHLFASLIGDILWEHNDWTNVHKLLDAWGIGVKFVKLFEFDIERKYGRQSWTADDLAFLEANPKLRTQLNKPDAKPGDLKYLTAQEWARFAAQPVPILTRISPQYTESELPVVDYLTISKGIGDISQLHNASTVSAFDSQVATSAPFWDVFIGNTRIGSDAGILSGAPRVSIPPSITNTRYLGEALEPYMLNYLRDEPEQANADKSKYGYFSYEYRVNGVAKSPYIPEEFPNFPAREIAIIVAQLKRKVRTELYNLNVLPVPNIRAGDLFRIIKGRNAGAVLQASRIRHSFSASGTISHNITAYRLNPDARRN